MRQKKENGLLLPSGPGEAAGPELLSRLVLAMKGAFPGDTRRTFYAFDPYPFGELHLRLWVILHRYPADADLWNDLGQVCLRIGESLNAHGLDLPTDIRFRDDSEETPQGHEIIFG